MLQPGQIIEDKYRIVRLIGQGGMGEVYEGENVAIARRVAIKVLLNDAATSPDIVQRFEREAQAAGRIGNDHILEVLDLGTLPGGDRFMVMEFLDGEALNTRITRLGRLTASQAIPLMLQALVGLSAAHAAGIIHRDLKPENIFVIKQKAGVLDFVKIIDFGISKFNLLTGEGMKMTRTGSVMGTPYYMSPEQANGSREADARSDLYAMGVILYEAVTGAVPFDGKTFNELLFKIVLSDPPPPHQLVPDIDPGFEAIILKAMAREAAHRFQTCEEFGQALREYQTSGVGPTKVPTGLLAESASAVRIDTRIDAPATGTGASWSKTDGDIPKNRSTSLVVGLIVGFLLLGGGALAAMKLRHSDEPAAATATRAATPTAEPAPVAPPAPPVVAPTPALVEVAPAALPSATAALAPSSAASAGGKASGSVATPRALVAAKPGAVSARVVSHPASAVPATLPTKPPAAKPAAGGSTDFGY